MSRSALATQLPRAPKSTHSVCNRLGRVLWGLVYTIAFRPSPRNLHRWRNWLLRVFGAEIHRTARVYPRARCWAPWNLTMDEHSCIGDDVDVYCVAPVKLGGVYDCQPIQLPLCRDARPHRPQTPAGPLADHHRRPVLAGRRRLYRTGRDDRRRDGRRGPLLGL